MFAVVKLAQQEKSFWSRFKRPKITSERVVLPNGECFFVITAEKKGDKVPFKEILSFSGNLRDSLIFENDFVFDSSWNYTPFVPADLRKKLLFDLAVRHLQKAKLNPAKTCICISDSEGLYRDSLEKMVSLAAKIHIITPDRSIYENEVKRLLFEYGVSVTLSGSFDSVANNCNVAVSHTSGDIPLTFSGIIFTNEKRPFINSSVFSVQSAELPFEYEKLRPSGVDKFIFASALYEKCKVKIGDRA